MTAAWVIGSSGLLGSALCRVLRRTGTTIFTPADHFCWNNERKLDAQLTSAVKAFIAYVNGGRTWELYWAAGVGTMSSRATELAGETRTLANEVVK